MIDIGVNSWETVVECETYFTESRPGGQAWLALPDTSIDGSLSKENTLIQAYNLLLNKSGYTIPADSTDPNVKNAQSEMALSLVSQYFEQQANMQQAGIVVNQSGKDRVEYSRDTAPGSFNIPIYVSNFLTAYIDSGAMNQEVCVE